MDRWRRWRARGLGGHAGARRAGVTALAVLTVTAALALLLAVLSHQAWPPVLVAILGTLPALYLAWLAVPGVIGPPEPRAVKQPAYDRLTGRWDPVELGVHQVIGGGPTPAYICRPHDEGLRAVLDPAVPASRLVVVRGGSSTGKTRAAYEAVADQLSGWRLDYPLDPGALAARLETGIPARTVLWLGELRQYADADGGAAVLGRLADLLQGEGHMVITTMWPEQWNTYTDAARAGPGAAYPAGTAGRLLERLPELTGIDPAGIDPARGGVIDVPDRFTTTDLEVAARTSDPVLAAAAAAAAAAGQDGQLTQYLAGVPDLLDRYDGPGADPYGRAIIAAAMDATRLGHASPLPSALLQEAAVGYLTGPQRTQGIASWRDTALAWATEELKGAVRAVQPVPPLSGTGVVGYQVADYLDQHGRRTRQDQLGPASLWDALTAHAATAGDLTRLGQAARDRGLYRHAAALWTRATALGNADAPRQLITHLRQVSHGDTTRAAQWVAETANLDSPEAAATLLRELRAAGVGDTVRALAARSARHASPDNPRAVATLLRELRTVGADHAARTLADRAIGHVSLDNPQAVAMLLRELREGGAGDAVHALLARDPASHASLGAPQAVATLLYELRAAGADDAARTLADRAAGHVSLGAPWAVELLLGQFRAAGADDAARTLADRAIGHVSLDNPQAVASLLGTLRAAGTDDAVQALLPSDPGQHDVYHDVEQQLNAMLLLDRLAPGDLHLAGVGDAVHALLARDPASHASLDDPGAVATLLHELRTVGADHAARTLIDRAVSHASLDNPQAVAMLLRELREDGAGDAVHALLARDPASHASLGAPQAVATLLYELRAAGADHAARTLADRAAGHVSLDDPGAVATLLSGLSPWADDAARTLADRAVGQANLDDPGAVAWLLLWLRRAGADDKVHALLARDPASCASPDNLGVNMLLYELRLAGAGDAARTLAVRAAGHTRLDAPEVPDLLRELAEAGADDAARILADRAANGGKFGVLLQAYPNEASSYLFGREPDGTPSQSWIWHEAAS